MKNSEKRDPPQKILIVKLSAIGDVIQTLPVAEALRKQYPEAHIAWVVEEEAGDLLTGHPTLDRVIVSRRKTWQKRFFRSGEFWSTLREVGEFIRDLRKQNYDWVIDTHGLFKSALLVFLSRGKRKIGYRRSPGIAEEGSYLFTNERYEPLSVERHALERYLDLVARLGVRVDKPELRFSPPADSLRKAESLVLGNGLLSRPLVIIHPMAKWPTKLWPGEKFAALAESLVKKKGASVIFTGSREDREPVEKIVRRIGPSKNILILTGQTSLKELAGLFSFSDLVVTTDTGPMHLAAAVHAPLIALFGPTAPWRTGPYGDGPVILRQPLGCSPCFRKKCDSTECMNSLSVEAVLKAAEAKLDSVGNALPSGGEEKDRVLT